MKCPKCKHVFETEEEREEIEKEERDKCHDAFARLFISNFILIALPIGLILSYLDKKFILGWSIETGGALNYYLFPMVFIACFYLIYSTLYLYEKVKGGLFIIKA